MASHVNNENHLKVTYGNFGSALMQCHKHNSRIENLGKPKMVPYACKICGKIHTGRHSKTKITFKVQGHALQKVNEILNKSILIKNIIL